MSREIKFRAFDPLDKKMMGPWDWDDILRGEMTIHPSGDECDVMQFTGLHDKNGVEIYEGDIVKDGLGESMTVEFDQKCASFIFVEDDLGLSMDVTEMLRVEVVGNIYEPEAK